MNEIEHLKSMWGSKVKRKTDLIVPQVTYKDRRGSLHNDSWAFKVTYSFREALDIKYEERRKNKKPYMVWTQGPIISFKEGDLIHSKNGSRSVQVRIASQMGWDTTKEEMYQGNVIYSEYAASGNSVSKPAEHTCTQMEFLQLLINGAYDS